MNLPKRIVLQEIQPGIYKVMGADRPESRVKAIDVAKWIYGLAKGSTFGLTDARQRFSQDVPKAAWRDGLKLAADMVSRVDRHKLMRV